MSTPKTTFFLTSGTKLTDVYPLESNGVGNLSVPNEIIDVDGISGGSSTVTVFGDLRDRMVSLIGASFSGNASSATIICSDQTAFDDLINNGLRVGMFVEIPKQGVETSSPLPDRTLVIGVDATTRTVVLDNNLITAVSARTVRFITPFSIIDLDPLTPSPYVGEYGASSCSFTSGASTITISPATPLVPATFDIVGVSIGTNGAWVIQGLTNARDVFYPSSTFTVADNPFLPANTTYTVGAVAQSSSYDIVDVWIDPAGLTNPLVTVSGNVGQFFIVTQQLTIKNNTTHTAGPRPLNGSYNIVNVSAYNSATDTTVITVQRTDGYALSGASGPATGKISPAIPTAGITVTGFIVNGTQPQGKVLAGAPVSTPFIASNPPSITPTTPHTYVVTWYVAGDKTAVYAPGASVTIKNNNYYRLNRLTVDSSSFVLTNSPNPGDGITSIRTTITDPSAATPVIGSSGSIVYPAIPVPYGHIQYTVLDVASPLQLVGRGVTHYNDTVTWGQSLQNNAIHQLENFNHTTPPVSPLEGQFWYNPAVPSINIRHNDTWQGVAVSGLPMQGDLDLNGNSITNLGDAVAPTDALNLQTGDARYVNAIGDTMTGALEMSNNPITGLLNINQASADPTQALNVASGDERYVNVTGDAMTGNLVMGSNRVTNMGDPQSSQDAATKSYVDSLSSGIVWLQSVLDPNLFDDSLSSPPGASDPSLLFYRSYYVKPVKYAVSGVNAVTKTWRVEGDRTSVMAPGDTFTIADNDEPTANTTYTIATVVTDTGGTLITVDETISSAAMISGNILHTSGAWSGKSGHVMSWNGLQWIDVLDRAVQVGDRFGVFFEVDNDESPSTTPGGSFAVGTALGTSTSSAAGKIITANAISSDFTVDWGTTSGSTYPPQTPAEPDAVSVLGTNSSHYGHSYTFRGMWSTGLYGLDYKWIEFAGPAMLVDGSGLKYTGNVLNVGQGTGITVGANTVGINTTYMNNTYMRRDGTTDFTGPISLGSNRIINTADPVGAQDVVTLSYLNANYMVTSGASVMSGALDLGGFSITSVAAPVFPTDAANMEYVDTKVAKAGDTMTGPLVMSSVGGSAVIDMGVTNRVINLADAVSPMDALNLQTADGRYLNILGDTMAGPLTLASEPTQSMHAATKQYVDAVVTVSAIAVQAATLDGGSF